jgi:hypothetical protein
MTDLKDARALWLKAILFLMIGLISAGLLLLDSPRGKTVALLALLVWACCRAYYFAFYVIQQYLDPSYRFSGLGSFVRYALSRRQRR